MAATLCANYARFQPGSEFTSLKKKHGYKGEKGHRGGGGGRNRRGVDATWWWEEQGRGSATQCQARRHHGIASGVAEMLWNVGRGQDLKRVRMMATGSNFTQFYGASRAQKGSLCVQQLFLRALKIAPSPCERGMALSKFAVKPGPKPKPNPTRARPKMSGRAWDILKPKPDPTRTSLTAGDVRGGGEVGAGVIISPSCPSRSGGERKIGRKEKAEFRRSEEAHDVTIKSGDRAAKWCALVKARNLKPHWGCSGSELASYLTQKCESYITIEA
ncbi:hypothetical protein B0H14DRAFT_2560655 [Mycena olivaceomarginata]|nr:hypothetical protein B0H14DRAFT_2560655 [Mycena olivaceomarginata]